MNFLIKKKKLTAETLQTALMLYHTEYMKNFIIENNSKKIEIDRFKLQECGLGKTVNAKILGKLGGEQSNFEIIHKIKATLPNSLIIPYSDLFKVMKEYNLAVGKIEHYEKIIPEENILQIYEAYEDIKRDNISNLFNNFDYIREIEIDSDLPKKLLKKVVNYVAHFPIISDYDSINSEVIKWIGNESNIRKHVRVHSDKLYPIDWLIAAPVQDLPDNTTIKFFSSIQEEKRRILEDPIVFKLTEVGAVIVSMWGKEADSKIFDKYR